MRSQLPSTAFALILLASLGCGSNQPPTTVYVTVPQTVSKPAEGSSSRVTVASERKGVEKVVDEKAEKLKKVDAEVMEAYRTREFKKGYEKLLGVVKEYRTRKPSECSTEEARTLAILYIRLLAAMGKQLGEESVKDYESATKQYSLKGGVTEADYIKWFQTVMGETDRVIDGK